MPTISPASLARVVAQAHGYSMGAPFPLTDRAPQGYRGRSTTAGRDHGGLNPQQLPPGRSSLFGFGIGPRIALRRWVVQPPQDPFHVGQGQFGGTFATPRTPNCWDKTTWLEGVPPANCPKTLPKIVVAPKPMTPLPGLGILYPRPPPRTVSLHPVAFPPLGSQLGAPPCAPQPCTPVPCYSPGGGGGGGGGGDGGPIGGSPGGGCPPCPAPPIPWGWGVITALGALLSGLQFYGKIGGGHLT
jgi:hypothetical protein